MIRNYILLEKYEFFEGNKKGKYILGIKMALVIYWLNQIMLQRSFWTKKDIPKTEIKFVQTIQLNIFKFNLNISH